MSPKEVARFVASRFYEKESLEGSKNLLGRQAAKGPRQGLEPGGRWSEDKASVHGTTALPTELMDFPYPSFKLCMLTCL